MSSASYGAAPHFSRAAVLPFISPLRPPRRDRDAKACLERSSCSVLWQHRRGNRDVWPGGSDYQKVAQKYNGSYIIVKKNCNLFGNRVIIMFYIRVTNNV